MTNTSQITSAYERLPVWYRSLWRALRLGLLISALLLSPILQAHLRPAALESCSPLFGDGFNMTFEFEPDIALSAEGLTVRWKGKVIQLTRYQFMLLESVLTATGDVVSNDELIMDLYGTNECESPEGSMRVQLTRLRQRFRRIDPGFDRLKVLWGKGMYWEKARHEIERIQAGRLSLAKDLHLAWWDNEEIKLMKAQHTILLKLMSRKDRPIRLDSLAPDIKVGSFQVMMCKINQAFEKHAHGRLIVSAREIAGAGFVRLNTELLEIKSSFKTQTLH